MIDSKDTYVDRLEEAFQKSRDLIQFHYPVALGLSKQLDQWAREAKGRKIDFVFDERDGDCSVNLFLGTTDTLDKDAMLLLEAAHENLGAEYYLENRGPLEHLFKGPKQHWVHFFFHIEGSRCRAVTKEYREMTTRTKTEYICD